MALYLVRIWLAKLGLLGAFGWLRFLCSGIIYRIAGPCKVSSYYGVLIEDLQVAQYILDNFTFLKDLKAKIAIGNSVQPNIIFLHFIFIK